MTLVDSHAHLEILPDLESVLDRAKESGVGKIITIGTDLESSKNAANLAVSRSKPGLGMYATVGIHPGDGKADVEKFGLQKCIDELRKTAMSENVVGVGEAGLDYFLKPETINNRQETTTAEKRYQRELFEAQIKLAIELGLPLVIHCRNAWEEVFGQLLESVPGNKKAQAVTKKGRTLRGQFHSFTGGPDEAKQAVDLGFYVSFSGIVTFKNAAKVQEAAKSVPLDRILIETDSLYLAPEPMRGSQNEPKNVRIIGQFLDQHLNLPQGTIERQSEANARKLFGI